jgi:hypothetical protein
MRWASRGRYETLRPVLRPTLSVLTFRYGITERRQGLYWRNTIVGQRGFWRLSQYGILNCYMYYAALSRGHFREPGYLVHSRKNASCGSKLLTGGICEMFTCLPKNSHKVNLSLCISTRPYTRLGGGGAMEIGIRRSRPRH